MTHVGGLSKLSISVGKHMCTAMQTCEMNSLRHSAKNSAETVSNGSSVSERFCGSLKLFALSATCKDGPRPAGGGVRLLLQSATSFLYNCIWLGTVANDVLRGSLPGALRSDVFRKTLPDALGRRIFEPEIVASHRLLKGCKALLCQAARHRQEVSRR